jgi:hypothetical protein
VCQNLTELIQRAGRAVRDPEMQGIFLIMYEPWVLEVKLEDCDVDAEDDPDGPWNGEEDFIQTRANRTCDDSAYPIYNMPPRVVHQVSQ